MRVAFEAVGSHPPHPVLYREVGVHLETLRALQAEPVCCLDDFPLLTAAYGRESPLSSVR